MKRKIATWLPVFTGFYDNFRWEPDLENEADYYKETYNYIGELWESFDYHAWRLNICKLLCNSLENHLPDFITKIEFEHLKSPKEYNFETDAINCTIIIKPKAVRDYIYSNKELFDKYLHDKYTSRDGFMSFYSNNFEDWEIETSSFKDLSDKHKCGAILNFICENEEITENTLYEDLMHELNTGEYFEEDFYKKLHSLDNFIRDNYTKDNLLSLCFDNFNSEEFEIDEAIIRVSKEIASNTLKLNLK